nr:MAG TPA: hypothetical protein [Caudoviricetes sp.]
MTIEESQMMWKIELDNFEQHKELASKEMKKLYSAVDKVITEGIITYEDFTNDMIDELTTSIVEQGKNNTEVNRATEVDNICKRLAAKYEEKYKNRESLAGNSELSTDNTQVQDESGICEPECPNVESRGNIEEIN